MDDSLHLSKDDIQRKVQAYEVDHSQRYRHLFTSRQLAQLRYAAVMIPLFELDSQWHVLLTRRSDMLVEHRGQVAFPGGAREPEDTDLRQTALREMQEEIGVDPQDVDVFGHLGDLPVITGYCVRPYVGQIPWPYKLEISSDEVESVFHIPLSWLANPKNRKIQYRSYAGREIAVLFFDEFDGQQLWGASAEMTLALLSALNLIT
jgi:8-oxo-dGTP pyrophosphatase MutT (NUDIX family)